MKATYTLLLLLISFSAVAVWVWYFDGYAYRWIAAIYLVGGLTLIYYLGLLQATFGHNPKEKLNSSVIAEESPAKSTEVRSLSNRSRIHRKLSCEGKIPNLYHAILFVILIPLIGVLAAGIGGWVDAGKEKPISGIHMHSFSIDPDIPTAPLATNGFQRIALFAKPNDDSSAAQIVVYGSSEEEEVVLLKRIVVTGASWSQWEGEINSHQIFVQAESAAPGEPLLFQNVEVVIYLIP